MRLALATAIALVLVGASAATHPCEVLALQKEGNARARAAIPEGAELVKEFVSFHEYFADAQDDFARMVDDMYAAYMCEARGV